MYITVIIDGVTSHFKNILVVIFSAGFGDDTENRLQLRKEIKKMHSDEIGQRASRGT
jgi:hypothetical protein